MFWFYDQAISSDLTFKSEITQDHVPVLQYVGYTYRVKQPSNI